MIRPKYDMLFQSMLKKVMRDLLLFVESDIGKELDLERGFQYLDKELTELYPQPQTPSHAGWSTNFTISRRYFGSPFNRVGNLLLFLNLRYAAQ